MTAGNAAKLTALVAKHDPIGVALSVVDSLPDLGPMPVEKEAEGIALEQLDPKGYWNSRIQRANAQGENRRRLRVLMWAVVTLRASADPAHSEARRRIMARIQTAWKIDGFAADGCKREEAIWQHVKKM